MFKLVLQNPVSLECTCFLHKNQQYFKVESNQNFSQIPKLDLTRFQHCFQRDVFVLGILYAQFPQRRATWGQLVPIKGLNLTGLAWEDHFLWSVQPNVPSDYQIKHRTSSKVTAGCLRSPVVTDYKRTTDWPPLPIKHRLRGRRSPQVTQVHRQSPAIQIAGHI